MDRHDYWKYKDSKYWRTKFFEGFKESILKIEPMEIIISDKIKNFRILKDSFKIFEKQISIIPDSFYEIQNTTITIKYLLKTKIHRSKV